MKRGKSSAAAKPAPTSAPSKKCRLEEVELVLIHSSPTNPRKIVNEQEMEELTASVREKGVLQPILLRPHPKKPVEYECVAGSRRRTAASRAGLRLVPALIREMTDLEVVEAQLVENGQRVDPHPLEEAEAIERIHNPPHNMTVEEIADKLTKSVAYVYSRLRLCVLTEVVRALYFDAKFSASVALLLARVSDPKRQERAAKELAAMIGGSDGGLVTLFQARQHLERTYFLPLDKAPFNTSAATLVPLAGPCTSCPKRSGNQGELFAEVAIGDTCTDAACYEKKTAAAWREQSERAARSGQRVLPDKQAREIFKYSHGDSPSYNSGYLSLDTKAHEDPKNRTYRQLLGKKLADDKVTLAQHPESGRPVELVPQKEMSKLLKAAGHDFAAQRSKERTSRQSPAEKASAARMAKISEARSLTSQRILAAAVEIVERDPPGRGLWLAVLAVQVELAPESIEEPLQHLGIKVEEEAFDDTTQLEVMLKSLTDAQLRRLAFETVVSVGHREAEIACSYIEGVDRQAIARQVRKELRLPDPRDPLTVACPNCKAKPGESCHNYDGKACATHRIRGDEAETQIAEPDKKGDQDPDEPRCRVCRCSENDPCRRAAASNYACAAANMEESLCTDCVDHQQETRGQTFRRIVREQGSTVYVIQKRWPELTLEQIDDEILAAAKLEEPAEVATAPSKKKRGGKKDAAAVAS